MNTNELKPETIAWMRRIAALNNCSMEEVISYIDSLSHGGRVIHHLRLA